MIEDRGRGWDGRRLLLVALLLMAVTFTTHAATLEAPGGKIRLDIHSGQASSEVVSIQVNGAWRAALTADGSAARLVIAGNPDRVAPCTIVSAVPFSEAEPELMFPHAYTNDRGSQKLRLPAPTPQNASRGLVLHGTCSGGTFEERVRLTRQPDVLNVSMQFKPNPTVKVRSLEDRYSFAPGRRNTSTPTLGPVDFVWSQNIKNEKDGDIPIWGFKSPVVMLQQGSVFTALMPQLNDRLVRPLALDLDVTSDKLPWLSYGEIPSEPYGHSYFRRSATAAVQGIAGVIEYRYRIVASDQPAKLGYRRVVRLLWADTGHDELMRSENLQQNVVRRQLVTFSQWQKDTWIRYANEVYRGFPCGSRQCGTLISDRNPWGHWDQGAPDAWFNAWFETLRSAYGWYLYGRNTGNASIESKAESVLNLALSSPQNHGAFPTIYLLANKRWIRDDGWAGFPEDYHAFDMSWTAYWMLQWADLLPQRKSEILAFVRPYGDFLVEHQLPSGVIPSWYSSDLKPAKVFREYNSETAASALLLASLYRATGNRTYLNHAIQAMGFIEREVLPRQRWYDFETFFSCARKPLDFYDPWTAQYPQNNLSQIQAAKAYLAIYDDTRQRKFLDLGTHVLDYLLLTQQVWNNPAFTPKLVGGFTTQNTDAEWSDARESYAAVLLWDYYKATGREEYLERAVAAARSTFAVAPWENWAHTGYMNIPGALTGFHWGPGSGMTSFEIMHPALGGAFIDVARQQGVGFDASSLQHLHISKDRNVNVISFNLAVFPHGRSLLARFSGVDPQAEYRIVSNGVESNLLSGKVLAEQGYLIRGTSMAKHSRVSQ